MEHPQSPGFYPQDWQGGNGAGGLQNVVFWTWQSQYSNDPTRAVATCIVPTQDGIGQQSAVNQGKDHRA